MQVLHIIEVLAKRPDATVKFIAFLIEVDLGMSMKYENMQHDSPLLECVDYIKATIGSEWAVWYNEVDLKWYGLPHSRRRIARTSNILARPFLHLHIIPPFPSPYPSPEGARFRPPPPPSIGTTYAVGTSSASKTRCPSTPQKRSCSSACTCETSWSATCPKTICPRSPYGTSGCKFATGLRCGSGGPRGNHRNRRSPPKKSATALWRSLVVPVISHSVARGTPARSQHHYPCLTVPRRLS